MPNIRDYTIYPTFSGLPLKFQDAIRAGRFGQIDKGGYGAKCPSFTIDGMKLVWRIDMSTLFYEMTPDA